MTKPIVFSGVQPTGSLHLGNYLGAIRQFVDLQKTHDCLFCVVDLHAITAKHDPAGLKDNTRLITAAYLASGINPDLALIFRQSDVPEHAEMAWLLNCVARMGWLERMTQFKDKVGENQERASVGLFAYPVLMAADILAYGSHLVPVGDDQKQHIELTRDIAKKFNKDFGGSLVLPKALGSGAGRIMSLSDGTSKMSKSDPDPLSRINLLDSDDEIARKVRKAKTDPEPLPGEAHGLESRPEAKNLVTIYSNLSGIDVDVALYELGGLGFGKLKERLTDLLVTTISPMRNQIEHYMADTTSLDNLLADAADDARRRAQAQVAHVKHLMGF